MVLVKGGKVHNNGLNEDVKHQCDDELLSNDAIT